ncbi:MAG: hypothetical protein L3J34_00305 [Flavobacteriaceae bacterium]|nr:hypothetical protein [Flavobacteriaceae bacterium]
MKLLRNTIISLLTVVTTSVNAQYEKRANPNDYTKPVMKAIAYGITAPSPHNTQSWYLDTISGYPNVIVCKTRVTRDRPTSETNSYGSRLFYRTCKHRNEPRRLPNQSSVFTTRRLYFKSQ